MHRLSFILVFVSVFAGRPEAQTQPRRIRIFATGSFLGQFDGMFEYPAHSKDAAFGGGLHPYGGLLGVRDYLAKRREATDLLLIAGDNPSHEFREYLKEPGAIEREPTKRFFETLSELQPTAIGLWSEDFYRALAPSGAGRTVESSAGLFAQWLRGNRSQRPFLASNAAIRFHADGLNTVKDEGIELEIDENVSLAWITRLALGVPCDAEDLTFMVTDGATGPDGPHVEQGPLAVEGTEACHAEIRLGLPLKPGRRYALIVKRARATEARLAFSTDLALTPSAGDLPAIDAGPDRSRPIVIGMVDPDIRGQLPDEYWEWPAESSDPVCKPPAGIGEKCEIVLLDPSRTLDSIRAWFSPNRERYFALIAGLSDEQASALLSTSDDIKFAVLPHESAMLGLGARARDARDRPAPIKSAPPLPYSGSSGNVAILDAGVPPAARVWGRAEWIGENVVEMHGTIEAANGEWLLTSPHAASDPIPGRRLCAVAKGDQVEYYAAEHSAVEAKIVRDTKDDFLIARAKLYPPYIPDRTYDDRNKQGRLWIDRNEFAAMVLDRMRNAQTSKSDIALFREDTIDDDYISYFAAEHNAGHALDWMSKEMLRRALFRADRIVRVRLSGSDLAGALGDMMARARDDGREFCVAGIGRAGCGFSRIDREHLLVNGRAIVPEHYYGVAMPAGIAAEFGLDADETSANLVDLVDRGFATATGDFDTCAKPETRLAQKGATTAVAPLARRLEDAGARRVQPYLRFAPIELTYESVELIEPEGKDGAFSQTPIEGRGAKDTRRFAFSSGVDAGLDWRRATWRFIGTLERGTDRIEDPASGEVIRSDDPDEYLIGTRLDWKVRPFVPTVRWFAGAFVEGELVTDRFDDISPEPQGVQLRRFAYGSVGIEIDRSVRRRFFELRQIRASVNSGKAYNERTDVLINGESFDLSGGLNNALRRYRAEKGAISSILFEDVEGLRTRLDVSTLVAVPFYRAFDRRAQLEVTTKGRWYVKNEVRMDLAEKRSLRSVWKLTFPASRHFSVGFEVDGHIVQSESDDTFIVWRTKTLFSIPIFGRRAAGFIW